MTHAELDAAALEVGRDIWRAALLGDRDLALCAGVRARELQRESVEIVIITRLPWRDAAVLEDEPAGIRMRSPCGTCGSWAGIVRLTGGQHVVRCAGCTGYAYCAPRAEVATW